MKENGQSNNVPAVGSLAEKRMEKRDSLYAKVDGKVDAIIETRQFIEEIKDLGVDEYEKACEFKLKSIQEGFDVSVQEKAGKKRALLIKLHDLYRQQDKLEEGMEEFEKYESKEVNELFKEIESIYGELGKLEGNDDVDFLLEMESFFRGAAVKRKSVLRVQQEISKDPDWMVKYFAKVFDMSQIPKEEMKIEISGININIFLKPEHFKKFIDKKCAGLHMKGTVFNFIKMRDNQDMAVNHEENHGLSEMFAKENKYSHNFIAEIKSEISGIIEWQKDKPLAISRNVIESKKRRIIKDMRGYMFENFDEIIADIDNLAEGKLNTYLSNFLRAIGEIHVLIDQMENGDVRSLLEKNLHLMKENFISHLNKISQIFFASSKIGKKEEAKAATILFGPENLRKISRHMESYDERYQLYEYLQPVISGGSFIRNLDGYRKKAPEAALLEEIFGKNREEAFRDKIIKGSFFDFFRTKNIKKLAGYLDSKEKFELDLTDKYLIIESLDWILADVGEIFKKDASLYDVKNILEYDRELKNISQKLGIKPLENFVENYLSYNFMYFQIEKAMIADNFEELKKTYDSWTLDKKFINEALLDYFGNGFAADDYSDMHGVEYNSETIKESKYYKFLESTGLDKKITPDKNQPQKEPEG